MFFLFCLKKDTLLVVFSLTIVIRTGQQFGVIHTRSLHFVHLTVLHYYSYTIPRYRTFFNKIMVVNIPAIELQSVW